MKKLAKIGSVFVLLGTVAILILVALLIRHLPPRSIHTPRTQARRRASQSATFNRYGRPHGNYAALTNKVRAAGIGWPDVPLMVACLLRALRSGPLETPAIAAAMSELRLERSWKPTTVTIERVRKTISAATQLGLVERLRKGGGPGRGRGPVGRPGLYALSEKGKLERRRPRPSTILSAELRAAPPTEGLEPPPASFSISRRSPDD